MNGEEIKRQINDAYYNDDMCSRYDLVDAVEDIVDENAHLREQVDAAHMSRLLTEAENEKLRELLHRLLVEYRYLRVRPRKMYLQHEKRMRAIEGEMRELGIEVD